jgi:predicted AAA+ superfamily ATPase
MFFERDILGKLIKWESASRPKPLLLRGARQVGKTSVLQRFGAN